MENINYMITPELLEKRKKIGALIRHHRQNKMLTQEELGNLVNFKQGTIAKIENGDFSPRIEQLHLILQALDLKMIIGNEII